MVHVGLGLSFGPYWVGHLVGQPMRISLGFLNVAHLTTQYMDVTSLLAQNIESFPRKLVVQSLFVHTGSVIGGDFVCSASQPEPASFSLNRHDSLQLQKSSAENQPELCLPSNQVTHGGIPLPLYKWRLNKCLLHQIHSNQRNFVIAQLWATSKRLSAIDAEMRQIQQAIQNRRRTLNLFLRNIRAVDSAAADERIRTSAANIRNLELRLEVLRKEQLELISEAVSRLSHSVTGREDQKKEVVPYIS